MAPGNYWLQAMHQRVTRRSVLRSAAIAGASLTGAALIGCNSGGGSPPATSKVATGATEAARKPRFGGSLKANLSADPPGWSVFTAAAGVAAMNSFGYDNLTAVAKGPGHDSTSIDLIPRLATAMPEQPDSQTYVFKIRQGVRFQNVAPVNGRPMTVEDVKYAVDTIRSSGPFKVDYAPVTSVTTPDAQTLVVKTDRPYAPLLTYSSSGYGWRIFPKEIIESKITETNTIGTGPYIRAQWDQGSKIVFKKNPDYWNKDNIAYLDEIHFLITPTSEAGAGAFATKQIDILASGQTCAQVGDLQARVKNTATMQTLRSGSGTSYFAFNTLKPPFNDVRVRRAMSLIYNREAVRQALFCGSVSPVAMFPFKEALLPADIPDLAANLKYDPKQAKDLMIAAGFANGFKTDVAWTPQYDADGLYTGALQLWGGDVKQLGVTINPVSHEYAKWIAEIYRPPFNWDGVCWGATSRGYYPDPDPYASYWLTPKGIANQSRINDPVMTALVEKQRGELNPKDRWNTLHEIQRLEAKNAYYSWRELGPVTVFTQNRVHDYVEHPAYGSNQYFHAWVDA